MIYIKEGEFHLKKKQTEKQTSLLKMNNTENPGKPQIFHCNEANVNLMLVPMLLLCTLIMWLFFKSQYTSKVHLK